MITLLIRIICIPILVLLKQEMGDRSMGCPNTRIQIFLRWIISFSINKYLITVIKFSMTRSLSSSRIIFGKLIMYLYKIDISYEYNKSTKYKNVSTPLMHWMKKYRIELQPPVRPGGQ